MKVYNITEDIHKIYTYLQQSIHEFVLYICESVLYISWWDTGFWT